MRLLSQQSREYKGKGYEKFWIVIPSKLVEKLGWKKGQDLEADVKGNKLIIEKD
jgi:bifunctional DNA-binding transcriptional regulator/antitoxin component of YhaV-PrlF toxin-antitoxin module